MIQVENLSKSYGDLQALKGVSFTISRGSVTGLLGLNGAGKTTCLKILTGFLSTDEGTATLDGIHVQEFPERIKGLMGYLPEVPPLYPELTVRRFLKFISDLRGIPEHAFTREFTKISELCGLTTVQDARISTLSLGYRKRTGIAQALIGSPPVLILDEPISGLDPRQIVEMRNLIRNLAGKHTILISSHILTEVSRTCDHVIIIHKGQKAGELTGQNLERLEDEFLRMTEDHHA